MARFNVISEKDAPRPTRWTGRLEARKREYEEYVNSVRRGQVGELRPDEGESVRGVALRVSRAAKRLGTPITTWHANGVIYFRVDR